MIIIIICLLLILIVLFISQFHNLRKWYNKQFLRTIYSDHQQLLLFSNELNDYNNSIEKTLELFHKFAEDNNIIYTLFAGSLIGYYRDGNPIPWDDDEDIMVRFNDSHKLHKLWDSGKNERLEGVLIGHSWIIRDIEIRGKKLQMLKEWRDKNNLGTWYKFKIPNKYGKKDIGGIDIGYIVSRNNKLYESMNVSKEAPGPKNDDGPEECPIVQYGNIKTRAIIKERGIPYLNKKYGKKWILNKHPLEKFINNLEPSLNYYYKESLLDF